MSENKKSRKRRFALPQIEGENIIHWCVVLAVFFSILTRCVVVRRTGVQGSAYFFAAYEVLVFLLLFFPVGVSSAVREQFGKRFETGFYRNAKRIFNAAVVALFFYLIVITLLWWRFSEGISGFMLLGKTNSLPLMWLLPVFVVDALTLLVRGFLDGEMETSASGIVFLVRQVTTFLFVLIFARVFHVDGSNVSKLFRNEEVKYVYGAAGVAIGFLIGAAVGLLVYFVIYFKHLSYLQRQVDRDQNRRRENSNGIMFTYATGAALAYIGMYSMIFIAQILSMHHFRQEYELVQSYQWGIFEGICQTTGAFPMLLIFLLYLGDSKQISRAYQLGDFHEVRIKCQNLTEFSMMLAFFFTSFHIAAAGVITKGLFGVDSVMAVRMLRYGSLSNLFIVYAFITCLELLFIHQKAKVALHCFGAAVVGGLALYGLLPSEKLGIYGIFVAMVIFSLVLTFANMIVLNRKIRMRADARHILWPFMAALISGALALLLNLLFDLFLPPMVSVILIFPICLLAYFVVGCKIGLITEYTFYGIPLGEQMERFGRMLKVL